jgi:hypothetical protein
MTNYATRGWEISGIPYPQSACDGLIRAANGAERCIHPHRTIPLFMEAMRDCAGFARMYLGPDVSGLGSYYFSQSAGYATHTDNDFIQAVPGTFLTLWLALTDVGYGNGGLVIGGKLIFVPKGYMIVLDGDVPHRSCAGFGPRPVCVLTYIKTGFPFRAGREERVEVPL